MLAVLGPPALAGCERKAPPSTPVAHAQPPIKPAVTVLNADVLVIEGKHVRLVNAFAPQPVPDARCWAEALAAKQATRVVGALVNRAETVTTVPSGQVDEYGRALASVHLDGADLGETLFNEGLAARRAKARFDWCAPVSRGNEGAPPIASMIEVTPGRAPGQ